MSRRHRGRPHHYAPQGADPARRSTGAEPSAVPTSEPNRERTTAAARAFPAVGSRPADPRPADPAPALGRSPSIEASLAGQPPVFEAPSVAPVVAGQPSSPAPAPAGVPADGSPAARQSATVSGHPLTGERAGQCTAPQLRRFIKSRPYVPMHELRRRFAINGDDDDVTAVRLDPGWIFVGLPPHEGNLLGDLLRTGEIGFELSLDPRSPIVIGVYPMRPIPRT